MPSFFCDGTIFQSAAIVWLVEYIWQQQQHIEIFQAAEKKGVMYAIWFSEVLYHAKLQSFASVCFEVKKGRWSTKPFSLQKVKVFG